MNIKKNIGVKDRVIRLVAGIMLFIAISFIENHYIQWFLFLLAGITFFEVLIGHCFIYGLLGKNTCPVK